MIWQKKTKKRYLPFQILFGEKKKLFSLNYARRWWFPVHHRDHVVTQSITEIFKNYIIPCSTVTVFVCLSDSVQPVLVISFLHYNNFQILAKQSLYLYVKTQILEKKKFHCHLFLFLKKSSRFNWKSNYENKGDWKLILS